MVKQTPIKSYKEMFMVFRQILGDPLFREKALYLKRIAKKTFFWIFITEIILVFEPYPVKWFFDGIYQQKSPLLVISVCLLIGVIYFLGTRVYAVMDRWRNHFFWRSWADLWGYSHYRELKLGIDWHVEHSTGEKESLITKNISKLQRFVDEVLFNAFPISLRIVFTSIGVWILGIHFGAVALVVMASFLLAMYKTEKVSEPFRKEFRKQMRALERDGTELTNNWRTLKQFGIEDDECMEHWEMLDAFCEAEKPRFNAFRKFHNYQEDTVSFSRALMYGLIFYTFDPQQSIGSIILATAWMEKIFSNYYRFSDLQRILNEAKEATCELCEIFEIVPNVRQQENPLWPKEGLRGGIEFSGVSFCFPNQDFETLKNINVSIMPFSCIALIGRTGSGKTTLTSLLAREYDPTKGAILINGVDLRKLDYNRYRKEIALVSQKIELFDGTVAQNIRKSNHSVGFEEIELASKRAHAHEFIVKLQKGYDTLIGEDGIQLSGGQRQRLAIARALVRNPKILILDEATSSLDSESQLEVQKAIDELIKSRLATIFIIAHRLSTVRQADLVIVLKDGQIAEIGKPRDLQKNGGLYRRFLEKELSGLNLEEFKLLSNSKSQ